MVELWSVYLCAHVCVCVCGYICMHMCMCICVWRCVHKWCIWLFVFLPVGLLIVCLCECLFTRLVCVDCMFECLCVCVFYICVCLDIHLCMYFSLLIYLDVCMPLSMTVSLFNRNYFCHFIILWILLVCQHVNLTTGLCIPVILSIYYLSI